MLINNMKNPWITVIGCEDPFRYAIESPVDERIVHKNYRGIVWDLPVKDISVYAFDVAGAEPGPRTIYIVSCQAAELPIHLHADNALIR
jgi:hypothetical protein